MEMENWKELFEEHGAIWIHDGRQERPHALLTSGLHSDGFVNCTYITQRPGILQKIVSEGMNHILSDVRTDWVIGSAFGAITLAHAIAFQMNARAGFTEKDDDAMKLSRFEIGTVENVLVVEDTISTGGSTLKTIEGIRKSGVDDSRILPYIVCLVNRSGSEGLGGRKIRALLTLNIHAWKAEECPLCKAGSQPVRPKSHWKELVRKT
jgi:orotate phosphoribosyltransferase